MTMLKHHPIEEALDQALAAASAPPAMPPSLATSALQAFPAQKSVWQRAAVGFGALAASLVVGFGGFSVWQARQAEAQAIAADADAFAQDLLIEDLTEL